MSHPPTKLFLPLQNPGKAKQMQLTPSQKEFQPTQRAPHTSLRFNFKRRDEEGKMQSLTHSNA